MTNQSHSDQSDARARLQGHNAEYIEHVYTKYTGYPAWVGAFWTTMKPAAINLHYGIGAI